MTRSVIQGIAIAVMFALGLSISSAQANTVVWRQSPIPVELVVGVEQLIRLPANAEIGLPPVLANPQMFRTLVTGGMAYWTALEPFETQRIQARLASGEFLLFDVSARTVKAPPSDAPTLQVVMPGDTEMSTASNGLDAQKRAQGDAVLFELLRYAAQSIYAPTRLIAPLPGIREVPVGLSGNLSRLYDRGRQPVVVMPHRSWAAGDFYVTAFIVTNEATRPIELDNRRVMHTPHAQRSGVDPHFVASAVDRQTLPGREAGRVGGNRTTLFIVTDRPIRAVIQGAGV